MTLCGRKMANRGMINHPLIVPFADECRRCGNAGDFNKARDDLKALEVERQAKLEESRSAARKLNAERRRMRGQVARRLEEFVLVALDGYDVDKNDNISTDTITARVDWYGEIHTVEIRVRQQMAGFSCQYPYPLVYDVGG